MNGYKRPSWRDIMHDAVSRAILLGAALVTAASIDQWNNVLP